MSQPVRSISELKSETRAGLLDAEVHAQFTGITERSTREGKPFLQVQVSDAADNFMLRVWNDHAQYGEISRMGTGAFVAVTGEFSQGGGFGLEARRWSCRPLTEPEKAAVLAGGEEIRVRQEACFAKITAFVSGIADPRIAAVTALFLEEQGARFRRSAAARAFHHARRGGLVEHAARMMEAAQALADVYPELNRDLLLAGALFHDAGKLWENHIPETGFEMPYDERGEMLGHIVIGIELINALWRKAANQAGESWGALQPPSEQVRMHLLHLIAAHHGELEFGSPVVPKTPEAIALHYLDNLDAKMEMFAAGYKSGAKLAERITERVKPLPGNLVEPLPHWTALGNS